MTPKERAKKWYYDNLDRAKMTRKLNYENHKDEYKARRKKWWQENKEKNKQNCKEYYQKNKLTLNKSNRERYYKNRSSYLEQKHKHFQENYPKLRIAALIHYGNGMLACVCCGENNSRFLTFDHKNNDGKNHRQQKGVGTNLLAWIIRNNFPDMFQTLCFNCNSGRALNKGICPHKQDVEQIKMPNAIHIEWHGVA